ncbi:hypothetical protein [Terasakiella pusilla]|uniref:hypothetical protein n=1 Tax=Terasakiella pusilla TaxID=64973 RepID=UPI003AA8CB2B
MSDSIQDWQRHAARLEFELGRLRETVENQFNRIDVLERRLTQTPLNETQKAHPFAMNRKDGRMIGFLKNANDTPDFYIESPSSGPLKGTPGYSCYALKGKDLSIIGIAVFDHTQEELESIVSLIGDTQRKSRTFIPIFLTNNPVFSPFRSQKYMYEYFRTDPSLETCMADETLSRFLQERFQYIIEKWGIDMIVDMSKEAQENPPQ